MPADACTRILSSSPLKECFLPSLLICLQYHFPRKSAPQSKPVSIKRSLMFQREIKKKLSRKDLQTKFRSCQTFRVSAGQLLNDDTSPNFKNIFNITNFAEFIFAGAESIVHRSIFKKIFTFLRNRSIKFSSSLHLYTRSSIQNLYKVQQETQKKEKSDLDDLLLNERSKS